MSKLINSIFVAKELNIRGSLRGPSSFTQKSPPKQQTFQESLYECQKLSNRQLTETTRKQTTHYIVSELDSNNL
jgi:myo-inositol-1-phosphate synthase